MVGDTVSGTTERVARTFPLSEWSSLARLLGDGMPLPEGIDWGTYTVELVERLMTEEDMRSGARGGPPSGHYTSEPPEYEEAHDPDGTVRQREVHGARVWRHQRTVIRHPDATARLEWERDGTTFGRIAIIGFEEDADPDKSCRILLKAIPLLRDYEWRGEAKAGRPELTDDDVRHDLEMALERCRSKGWERPTIRQLADWHDPRYGSTSDIAGVSERTLRDRRRKHPQPFRDLAPWIEQRKKA